MPDREHATRKAERTMIVLTILFVVGMGTFAFWWQQNHIPFTVTIPTPVLPKPNALDTYQSAYQQHVNMVANPARNTRVSPGSPNYLNISDSIDPKNLKLFALSERQALLKANAKALATLRSGFAQQYHDVPQRSYRNSYEHYGHLRELGRLLYLEGLLHAEVGNVRQATDSYLDLLYFGDSQNHGAGIGGMFVSTSIQAMARPELWPLVRRLSATDAGAAARRLEGMLAHRVSFADILQEQKWIMLASLQDLFSRGNWRGEFGRSFSSYNNFDSWLELHTTSKGQILRNVSRYMDDAIAIARQPYGAHLPAPPAPSDHISQRLTPYNLESRLPYANAEAQLAMLAIACALQAYRQEQGSYPPTLAALVPKYLSKVPVDPFSNGQPVRYQRTGKTYLLYSIGPDGKDDGGKAIVNAHLRSRQFKYLIKVDSKGDIVAGTNIN